MRPSDVANDARYQHLRDAKRLGDGLLAEPRIERADAHYVRLGQFGKRGAPTEAVIVRMLHVAGIGSPFKIADMVIGFNAIQVIDNGSRRIGWHRQERCCHKAMDELLAATTECHLGVSSREFMQRKETRHWTGGEVVTTPLFQTADAAVVANFVCWFTADRAPLFHEHIIPYVAV